MAAIIGGLSFSSIAVSIPKGLNENVGLGSKGILSTSSDVAKKPNEVQCDTYNFCGKGIGVCGNGDIEYMECYLEAWTICCA